MSGPRTFEESDRSPQDVAGSQAGALDEIAGPFGNPDGSRADLSDVLAEFVDFAGNPAYGDLSMQASDAHVRVIVGKKGAGKTVYLRRLQDYQHVTKSVYAELPQQSVPPTEVVVRLCQWFPPALLTEKWAQAWNRAILRSLVSHLLLHSSLRQHVHPDHLTALSEDYRKLLGSENHYPRSIYSQLRDIVNAHNTGNHLTKYLEDPMWDDLEYLLGEVLLGCPPIFFYVDALDDHWASAPMYWLRCQEGLFYAVAELLRDQRLGGRLHVVISLIDIVLSPIFLSENGPRYRGAPYIRLLAWTRGSLSLLLTQKLARLPARYFMKDVSHGRGIEEWLGYQVIENAVRGVSEPVETYILRHTRLIPRDLVTLGNALCQEVVRQKALGITAIPAEDLRRLVSRCARGWGKSQLDQCAHQISSDTMPEHAATKGYSEVYTGSSAYASQVADDLQNLLRLIGVDRFSRSVLDRLRSDANELWKNRTDLPTVLWQNGLLGFVSDHGQARFYSIGDADEFILPEDASTYVFHPCMIDSLGLRGVGPEPVIPFA